MNAISVGERQIASEFSPESRPLLRQIARVFVVRGQEVAAVDDEGQGRPRYVTTLAVVGLVRVLQTTMPKAYHSFIYGHQPSRFHVSVMMAK